MKLWTLNVLNHSHEPLSSSSHSLVNGEVTGALVSLVDLGIYQNWILTDIGHWLESEAIGVRCGQVFDSFSSIMLVVVTFISLVVYIYSMDYLSTDPFGPRFVSYLLIFTFLMLVYVTADNLLQAFVGWEGVGLSSFLLINFWKTRGQAVRSAIKALIFNRIGDFGLCLAMGGMYLLFGSLDFATMCLLAPTMAEACLIWMTFKIGALNFIGAWLILAAIGKSAQLGLHGWLSDAMEGPTPVSALIHAATMVTAGVFLIYRCSMILEYAPAILCFIASIGAHTALLAASSALVQNDIKKVIAFSTCSQLGYLVWACGLSMYASSFLH